MPLGSSLFDKSGQRLAAPWAMFCGISHGASKQLNVGGVSWPSKQLITLAEGLNPAWQRAVHTPPPYKRVSRHCCSAALGMFAGCSQSLLVGSLQANVPFSKWPSMHRMLWGSAMYPVGHSAVQVAPLTTTVSSKQRDGLGIDPFCKNTHGASQRKVWGDNVPFQQTRTAGVAL